MNNQVLFQMLVGENIENKYYLKSLLGTGSFGGVYLADEVIRDRCIRELAVKIIITDNPDKQLDELIFSTTLEHPNLINCYTCGECELNNFEFLYLLMEKADYSLEDELKKGKLSEEKVKQLVLDIANGLNYLHSQNLVIVHRDLKPGNILKVGDKWKISDFGLVRSLLGTATQTSTISGTIAYAPPEAYDGKISPAWDIWSLGVVIYESLTGKLPFEGDSLFQLMQQVINSNPDYSLISDCWQEIIKGCLIKDNKRRFSSQDLENKLSEKVNYKNNIFYNKTNNEKEVDLLLKNLKYLINSKQYEESVILCNQAIELNPNYSQGYVERGNFFFLLQEYQKAIQDLDRAIRLDPHFAFPYYSRGLVYCSLQKYQDALKDFNQAIELNYSKPNAYNNRGLTYFYLQQYEEALKDFNQAIKLDPYLATSYYNRGNLYANLQENDKAIKDLDQAIKLDPNYIYPYYVRGSIYHNLQEYEQALSEYTKVIELNPNYALAYNACGLIYDDLEQYEEAIINYTKAIELDPNLATAYNNRGLVYYKQQKYTEAISNYTKAIQLDPNLANAYNNLGMTYSDLQKYTEAIADYTKAIKLNPNDATTYNNRGNIYYFMHKYEEAIADYTKAIELDPNCASAYIGRSNCYYFLQEYIKYVTDYNQALKLNPNLANPLLQA